MRITVNSEPRDMSDGTTLAQLVAELGLDKSACAAEVNKTLIPKRQHAEQELRDGDTVELVTLVGGG
jgi:thiamine biosynthesis protein ThiS